MKLFNSANIDIINTCRWYSDFQLPSEVLVKQSAIFQRKFVDCKNLRHYFAGQLTFAEVDDAKRTYQETWFPCLC